MFIGDMLYYRTACDNINKRNTLKRICTKFKFTVIIVNINLHEYLG